MLRFSRGRVRPTIVVAVVPVLIAVFAVGAVAAFGLDAVERTASVEPPTADDHDASAAAPAPQTVRNATPETGSSHGTSGDPTTPQPLSNADQNDGGANGQCPDGPYCSTRDGSPSLNGSDGGLATGKPCAGCVGKADNKNPQGQLPGPSDANRGYECDANSGIGQSNPAHTGCTEPSATPTPTPLAASTPTPAAPSTTTPASSPAPTPAPTPTPTPTPTPPPTPAATPKSPPRADTTSTMLTVAVLPPVAAAAPPADATHSVLPNTGAPAGLSLLTGLGLSSIASGLVLLRGVRRRSA